MVDVNRVVFVCDKVILDLGIIDKAIAQLQQRLNKVEWRIIDYAWSQSPSIETVERGAAMMRDEFQPDTIIAIGGGSPMDARKDYVAAVRNTQKLSSAIFARSSSIFASALSVFQN